jgi:flagellar hook-associated protein 3 FlgL
MDETIGEIDNALNHVQTHRSDLGARMRYTDNTREENESVDYLLKKTRSDIEDTDYVKAISDLQTEMTALEAIRKSYAEMGQMSLFNYL